MIRYGLYFIFCQIFGIICLRFVGCFSPEYTLQMTLLRIKGSYKKLLSIQIHIPTYVIIYLQRAIHSSQVSPPIRHFGKDVFGDDLGHVFANIMQFMSSEQFWVHNHLAFCSLLNSLTAAACFSLYIQSTTPQC